MSSALVIIGLVLSSIQITWSLLATPTNCYVSWNTPSYGRSRVYFTYPTTSSSVYQMYVTHNDEYSVPNTDIHAAGNTVGYPSSPQANTEYYFEYAYNLEEMTTSQAEDYCTINSGSWACGAYIRGGSGGIYSNFVYCGFANVAAPTRSPTFAPSPTPKPTAKPTANPVPTTTRNPSAKPTANPTVKPVTPAPVTQSPTASVRVYINTYSTFNERCSDQCDDSFFSPVDYNNCGVVSLSGDNSCKNYPYPADDCYLFKWNWRRNAKYLSYTCDLNMWWSLKEMYNYDNLDLEVGYKIINTQTAQQVAFVTGHTVIYNGTLLEDLGWKYCEYWIDGRRSTYLMTRLELIPYDECTECQLLSTNAYILRDDLTTINIVYFAEGFRGYDEEIGVDDILYIMSNLESIGCPAPTPTNHPTTRPSKMPTVKPSATETPTYSWQQSGTVPSAIYVCKYCLIYIVFGSMVV